MQYIDKSGLKCAFRNSSYTVVLLSSHRVNRRRRRVSLDLSRWKLEAVSFSLISNV